MRSASARSCSRELYLRQELRRALRHHSDHALRRRAGDSFLALHRRWRPSGRRALGHLGTTQRALLSEANDWAASNPKIITQLLESPASLSARAPDLSDTRPWLVRLFDRPRRTAEPSLEQALSGRLGDAELLALARSVEQPGARRREGSAPGRDAEREELKALVDEALRTS